MNRITKDPEERRSELIATARRLIFEKGYESTSVGEIVNEIGVAQGTFYYYFESKMDVLDAIIEDLINEQQAVLKKIVDDDSLSAIPKWKKAIKASNDWKLDFKEGIVGISTIVKLPENSVLHEKYRSLSRQKVSLQIAKIIDQGIEEGVFSTNYPQDAAEVVIAIGKSITGILRDILLNPENFDNPAELAKRKTNAIQEAMERVLGASPGSLPILDETQLKNWFGN